MTGFRVSEAATLLGVSDDTVRRWIDAGRLAATRPATGGRLAVDGKDLAELAQALASTPPDGRSSTASARNRFVGIVTKVTVDGVVAQVEIQAGPHRIVSVVTAEAVCELGLETGVLASAVVKATGVVVEIAGGVA